MEKRNKKTRSIKHYFRFVTLFPITIFTLLIITVAIFTTIYSRTHNIVYVILLIAFSVLMVVIYAVYTLLAARQFQKVFVNGLYATTIRNFENISNNENTFISYPNTQYEEITALNEHVDVLKRELNGATLIPSESSYTNLELDYVDIINQVISFESFKKELENIIFVSQNYRNVLIEAYYELGDEILTDDDVSYIFKVLKENFYDYQNALYSVNEDKKSVYLYLPRIDTLSKINEQLETCMRNTSISKRLVEGVTTLSAHFSVVCYPYSDVHEIFPDLRYAKRQNKDIFFYLPNRLNTLENDAIIKNSMNLNKMSKIIAPLLNMEMGLESVQTNVRVIETVLKTVAQYFKMDYTGIISFDEVKNVYNIAYQVADKELSPLSKDGNIAKEFVDIMDKAKDDDYSYYFAFRNHANNALGRHLDRVGLESGFYYVVKDSERVVAVVYFFNKNKPFFIDSYVQESLVVLCNKIAMFILSERRDREVESSFHEIDSILKLTDYSTYRISNEDRTLLRASGTMKQLFPKLELGEKCYKTLYGLDAPCKDCPLLTGNKKSMKFGNDNYETSLVLSEHNKTYTVMAVKNLFNRKAHHRYNQDFIINSFHSLVENLENAYEINGKGYLLLLRIDNMDELIETHGSEGYIGIIRDFVKRIKKMHNGLENIYYYNNQFLSLLYEEYGQTDILDECEKIFKIAHDQTMEAHRANYVLNITFLPVSYPRVYPNAASFVKQADSFASRGKYAINKDFIYFDESDYSRSANREEFLLSVIKKAFGDRTFDVNLQPMVNANDKQIYGAELLLRIVDEYRNTTFRTDELVNIAAKHDQIAIISHALLDYIKVLYKDYGAVFFASLGFKRLALNTDYSFFTDKNFRNDIKKYLDEIKMPKHFLAFEIPESDVANHMNEFKEIAKMTKEFNIVLVCDQYTGRFVSVEMLKEIGFNEVKISRNLVLHIDSDNQRANALKQLLALIKRLDLKASIVGVENIDQYLLIKDADNTALLQGFYFYRPLEKQALIETIRGTNRRVQQEEPKNN